MDRKKCETPYCTNFRAKNKGKVCHKCSSRRYKEKYPFKYFYNAARNNARRRGIPWKMTLEEYKKLWKDSGKWETKLKSENNGKTWSIDRIDVNLGYTLENCQIVTVGMNVQLWHDRDKWKIRFRWRRRWAEQNGTVIEECPF